MKNIDNTYQFNKSSTEVFMTVHESDRKLSAVHGPVWRAQPSVNETDCIVTINPDTRHQQFMGIGAAITDSSAHVLSQLSAQNQTAFMKAHFCPNDGIGYSLIRTSIHSCDFSLSSYTYVEEGDKELNTFDISPDLKVRIPMIKKALGMSGKIPVYASPWSPPAFMKDSKNMLQGGALLPEYYEAWANYYVKFVEAYEQEGIPIWGITIQNEPAATQTWESCLYSACEERDFIKNYVGPAFAKAELSDIKIIIWDHNRDLMFQRVSNILSDAEAAKYVWGTGFHWYEDWKDGKPQFENVARVKEAFPDKELIFTEGCNESFDPERLKYPDPKLAERYAVAMINDFNNGTTAWTDWNILLDEKGGPNHVGNYCFAPVHADINTGELNYTYSYYYIGHFSKFIRPGATRVSCGTNSNQIIATSFLNTDDSLIAVVCNTSNSSCEYDLEVINEMGRLKLPAHSIQTIVLRSGSSIN